MSPLQYQKQLRLMEARRLMLAEYARMFGAAPIGDIQRLRHGNAADFQVHQEVKDQSKDDRAEEDGVDQTVESLPPARPVNCGEVLEAGFLEQFMAAEGEAV